MESNGVESEKAAPGSGGAKRVEAYASTPRMFRLTLVDAQAGSPFTDTAVPRRWLRARIFTIRILGSFG